MNAMKGIFSVLFATVPPLENPDDNINPKPLLNSIYIKYLKSKYRLIWLEKYHKRQEKD